METLGVTIEQDFRAKYGVPSDAEQVLILAESSHWDPNWLQTSEGYYQQYVEANLLQAISELQSETRRVYSVECMFFLRMFWDRHPELQDTIRQLVNQNRLRLTSSGVSSADTLLPKAEAILRDLLLGQEWLRRNGLEAEPRLAYFPDCFGHSPGLPALLNAAGFTMTAFARLDGMHGMGSDYDPKSSYPRPGSSAELLQKVEKTLDFIWQSSDGSQVLAHWNAYSYGQGDMIAYRGFMRLSFFPRFLYSEDRSDKLVFTRIQGYINDLNPYSRTPYLFCPLGMDFNAPVPDLLELLDRYNNLQYPSTGTWVVNASLEEYLDLVNCYRDRLPVIVLDPNPYWTGFYTSRPTLKQRCHTLLDQLLLAERLAVHTGKLQDTGLEQEDFHEAWWTLSTSNHHDFITGTSPDAVVAADQVPSLENALQAVHPIVSGLEKQVEFSVPKDHKDHSPAAASQISWQRQEEIIEVTTPFYKLELNEKSGGCITRIWHPETGNNLLEGISNELIDYAESGGLWRMGLEYKGGKFKLSDRSSAQYAAVDIRSFPQAVEFSSQVKLGGQIIRSAILCRDDSPWIRFRVTGKAAEGHTLCTRFASGVQTRSLTMENPGTIAVRPAQKIYTPTFWPMQGFCHLQDDRSSKGIAFLTALPGAAAYHPGEKAVELVALRNATREKAYGFIPILACPASGHELEDYTFQYALGFTSSGNWQENRLPQSARAYQQDLWIDQEAEPVSHLLNREVLLSSPDVWVESLKPAWRGPGIIARLVSYARPSEPVTLGFRSWRIHEAFACDIRERDLQPVAVREGQVQLTLKHTITSLRLVGKD